MATNIGTSGNDKIIGKNFADLLFGKGGNDKLSGKGGDDIINGGKGNDRLKGGDGADRFVFGKKTGHDVVSDFDVNKDVLQIPKGTNSINSPKDVLKHAVQKGDDVIIKLGDNHSIKLKNVDIDDLKAHPGDHFDIV